MTNYLAILSQNVHGVKSLIMIVHVGKRNNTEGEYIMAKVKKLCIKGHLKAKGHIDLEGNYKATILNMTSEEFRTLPKQEQIEMLRDSIDFYEWLDNADIVKFVLSEVEENTYD